MQILGALNALAWKFDFSGQNVEDKGGSLPLLLALASRCATNDGIKDPV